MEAADKATSLLVFHRDRLSKLRGGISRVLEAFVDVLDDKGGIASNEPAEVRKQLQEIEDTSWSRIREHFLDHHEPSEGPQEGRSVARLLLDFTNKLDDVKDALEDRLRELAQQKESTLQQEVKDLQKKLTEEKTRAADLKWKHQELAESSSSEKHLKGVLHQQLKEKQEMIAQLQRNGTVQLWEKEKAKLLEGSKQREENLAQELAQLRDTHEDMKDRLNRRIKDLEEKVKLERMKDIVSKLASKDEIEADVESLKRQLYIKEVDLARLDQELINQQRLFVGCIKGIQRDFRVMEERQEGRRLRKDDLQKMNAILDAILAGAKEARLEITKADLPLHYIAVQEDIVAHPAKRMTRPSILAPVISRHLETIGDSPCASPKSSPPGSPNQTPRRFMSLDLPHPNSSPALSSLSRSSTMPLIESSSVNGQAVSARRPPPSGRAKISVEEFGLIHKSPRSGFGAPKTPSSGTSPSGRSPNLTRNHRATSIPESARSPSLRRRRAVSSPVPPELASLARPPSVSPREPTGATLLPAPRQPSRSASPGGRNGMASARKARGSGKLKADTESLGASKEDGTSQDGKPQAKSTLTGSGDFHLEKAGNQRGDNKSFNATQFFGTEHPELIDKETGILDAATAHTCFPHMSEEQIREHYQQFKKYDTNGDYNLDFTEMTQAIQSTVADYYKPRQIKEAMVEIDVDQSGSVDFYEYLGVSTMLQMKIGKSEIFRSTMVKHAGGSISKVCSIQ
ncbi:stress response protein nst1-like isoform X2 [Acanthaster planci]|uniref:Stress response protein nst1-like isoform X2 n=1 Tax=Acanthaster planci TaxID=133434 RepID=A0A8B7YPW6_ACAPL|nr:stress response protein nst1-like isoform X2 [Acanthaster planci]XP_022093468.1 stress response protein nst1-like isoform X2 [Acanthaster planci]